MLSAPCLHQLITVRTVRNTRWWGLGVGPVSFLMVLLESVPHVQQSPQNRNTDVTMLPILKMGCMALHESIPSTVKMKTRPKLNGTCPNIQKLEIFEKGCGSCSFFLLLCGSLI